jgi:hypothetical protein
MGKWGRSSGVTECGGERDGGSGSEEGPCWQTSSIVVVLDLPDPLYRFRSSGLVIANTPGC